MPVTIKNGATIVGAGDSITAGTPPPNGWFQPALAQINTTLLKTYRGQATGGRASATGGVGVVTPQTFVVYVNSGVGGNKAADIEADIPGRILQYLPTLLVLEIGVNDATAATPLVSFRASIDAIFSTTLASFPTCELVAMSIFVWHEQWITSGGSPAWDNFFDPPPSAPGYTPSIAQYNAQLQASVLSFGGVFVDTRPDTLAFEAANNLPEPGAAIGPLTIDGLHPNLTGQTLMSNHFLSAVSVVP